MKLTLFRKSGLLFVLFMCTPFLLFAQQKNSKASERAKRLYRGIDSLKKLVPETDIEDRFKIFAGLSSRYTRISNDTALYYANKAYYLQQSLPDRSKKINARLALDKAFILSRMGQHDSAVFYADKSYQVAVNEKDSTLIQKSLTSLSTPYLRMGNFKKATPILQKANEIAKARKDTIAMSSLNNNLAIVHLHLRDTAKALTLLKIGLDLKRKKSPKESIALAAQNMAAIYAEIDQIDSAELYIEEALRLHAELGNSSNYYALAASAKAEFLIRDGKTDEAIGLLDKALKSAEKLKSLEGIEALHVKLSSAYNTKKDYKKALSHIEIAESIAQNSKEKEKLASTLNAKHEVLKNMGRYKEALEAYEESERLDSEILGEETSKQIRELEAKYESAQMQEQVSLMKKESEMAEIALERKNEQLFYGVIALVIVLLLSLGLLRINYKRQEANKLLTVKNEEISQQKEEIQVNAESLKEANAEISQQKEELISQAENLREVNVQLSHQNDQVTSSIRYAGTIQSAVLPTMEELNEGFSKTVVFYKPLHIVSGDFYWIENRPDGRKYFAVGDCTGHGVPGAFMSMLGITYLYEISDRLGDSIHPADMLTELDKKVKTALDQESGANADGMDIGILEVSPEADGVYKVRYAGARRPLFIKKGAEQIEKVPGVRRSIGGFSGTPRQKKPFENYNFKLNSGDTIYLTSDGYADQFSPERKKFSTPAFLGLLDEVSQQPLENQQQLLEEAHESHRMTAPQIDDITVLGIRLT